MVTSLGPQTSPPKDFKVRKAEPQGWWARFFRRPDIDGALAEIETALATRPWGQLTPEAFAECLRSKRVKAGKIQEQLHSLYRRALDLRLEDDNLSDSDREQVDRLELLLGLDPDSSRATRRTSLEDRYRQRLIAAVADRTLSDEEKKDLEELGPKLQLPQERVDSIRQEILGKVMKEEFALAIVDRRLSPEEDAHLTKIAADLGMKVSYDGEMQRLAERYRLLWRIEQGDLPAVLAPIRLQQGESCHWSAAGASLHELRTVTTRIGYSGPTARIRIMRGVYWRMGSLGVNRSTQDVLKLLDEGTLYLTSKRLLFDGTHKTTNVPLKRIINFAVYEDGLKIEKDSGKDQVFQFANADPEMLGALLNGALGRS